MNGSYKQSAEAGGRDRRVDGALKKLDIMQQVREDFNRIASLTAHDAEAQVLYSNYLLRHVPVDCKRILEVGCGFGSFTRLVANRAAHVTAIDLSPQMIEVARERSASYSNLEFTLGDFLQLQLPEESYDCVVTIATLHHLPVSEALEKMKAMLRPGGVLVLHDLLTDKTFIDMVFNIVKVPVNRAVRFWRTGRFWLPREVRRAWAEHGSHETYLKAKDVRAMRDEHLPGGRVHNHFLWRYTIVWRKPGKT
jgi:ubiquinone/menaquinone biosynthesis C-methylase UbiE